MNVVDRAWLVGILEGEGSFVIVQHNRPTSPRTPRVTVAMSDFDVVERVARLMETSAGTKPVRATELGTPRKPQWHPTIYGRKAVALMTLVRPEMGLRRGVRIDEILAEYHAAHSLEEVAA